MKTAWVLALLLMASPVRAEQPDGDFEAPARPSPALAGEPLRLGGWLDGSVVLASAAALGMATAIPVTTTSRWNSRLLPIDDHLEGRYSAQAARHSDVLLGMDVVAPIGLLAGRGFDVETGKRVFIYGETLLVALALDATIKPLVSRPRPYTYSSDPTVVGYATSQGDDTHLSFYSRHSSTAFAASVSGAYLFAQTTADVNARAAVWGVELAMAAATADLRTRAGMHFYSDVLAGAVIGASLGVLVPYLHGGPKVRLGKREWLAIVLGPLAGIALGELLPVSGS